MQRHRGRIRRGGARAFRPGRHRPHGHQPARHRRPRGDRPPEGARPGYQRRHAHHARHAPPPPRGQEGGRIGVHREARPGVAARADCRRADPRAREGEIMTSVLPTAGTTRSPLLRCISTLAKKLATLRKPSARRPSDDRQRLELLQRCSVEGIWEWDLRSDQVNYFPRFREMLGYSAEEPFSRLQLSFHPEDASRIKKAIRRIFDERASVEEEFRLRCKNGEYRWFRGSGHAVWDRGGAPLRVAGSITDISAYKENELRLIYLADHDALTGLPNRRHFLDYLSRAIERAAGTEDTAAVLFVDLDRFKRINDVFGHDAGNTVLGEAAKRIGSCVREHDTVARLGGDEFTVLLEGAETTAGICAAADRIRT